MAPQHDTRPSLPVFQTERVSHFSQTQGGMADSERQIRRYPANVSSGRSDWSPVKGETQLWLERAHSLLDLDENLIRADLRDRQLFEAGLELAVEDERRVVLWLEVLRVGLSLGLDSGSRSEVL